MPSARGALVSSDQHVLIATIVLALLTAAVWLERSRAGRLLPGPAGDGHRRLRAGKPRRAPPLGRGVVGTLLMYLFFGALGVGVDLAHFGAEAALIAGFILLAILVHLTVLVAAGRTMGASAAEVLVASMGGAGGPTTAAAFAASFRQPALITPGALSRLLGFASATFVGLALYGALAG